MDFDTEAIEAGGGGEDEHHDIGGSEVLKGVGGAAGEKHRVVGMENGTFSIDFDGEIAGEDVEPLVFAGMPVEWGSAQGRYGDVEQSVLTGGVVAGELDEDEFADDVEEAGAAAGG